MFLASDKLCFSQTTCCAVTITSDAGSDQTGCYGYPYTQTLNGSGSCTGSGCSGSPSYNWYKSSNCTGSSLSTNATYSPTVTQSTTYSLKVCYSGIACFTCTPCVCDAVVVSANCTCCRVSEHDPDVDEVIDNSILVLPNPSSDLVRITFLKPKGVTTIIVFNSGGIAVFEKTSDYEQDQNTEINLKPFGNGYYFIQVSNESEKLLFKRIIIL